MDSLFEKVKDYLIAHGASKIEVFGSRARKTHDEQSDLDLIVRFDKKPSLISLAKFERELSELTGIKVDLLTEKSISNLILSRISKERVLLY